MHINGKNNRNVQSFHHFLMLFQLRKVTLMQVVRRAHFLSQQIRNRLKTPFLHRPKPLKIERSFVKFMRRTSKTEIGGDKSYFSLTHDLKPIHNSYQLIACNQYTTFKMYTKMKNRCACQLAREDESMMQKVKARQSMREVEKSAKLTSINGQCQS